MLIPVLQLEPSYLRVKTSPDTLWSSNHMEKLQIAEGLALQSLEEERRSCSSLTASEGGFTPSSACMMGARTLTEQSKLGSRQLPTTSLVAMACGFGGYVIYQSDNHILATNLKLQLTDSLVHNLLPRLILPVFSRYIHNPVIAHMGSCTTLWVNHPTYHGCYQRSITYCMGPTKTVYPRRSAIYHLCRHNISLV
jgi:hypothetical protein